jgi:putative alpha-1,2-mannosidase
MRDLYSTGLTNGYGYCGDEDNGQTSLWYVFSAMGMYPACPGFPEYCIGSPLFDRVTLHLENGKTFVVSASGNGEKNIYVQSAKLNGSPYSKNYLKHKDIAAGGVFELTTGSEASDWGTGQDDVPSSVSK